MKLQSQPWCRLRRWAIKREADVLASLKCQKSKAKFPSSAPGPHLRSLSVFQGPAGLRAYPSLTAALANQSKPLGRNT